MLSFVKKNLKKGHSTLVARLVEKAHLIEARAQSGSMSVLDARLDSTLPGCGTGFRLGYQSGPYSDTSSLRGSRMSQSPHASHQFSTPLVSPSYHNVNPAYGDARDTYQNLPLPDTTDASNFSVQPQLSYTMELPADIPSHVSKLQKSKSTVHHELPARFWDQYDWTGQMDCRETLWPVSDLVGSPGSTPHTKAILIGMMVLSRYPVLLTLDMEEPSRHPAMGEKSWTVLHHGPASLSIAKISWSNAFVIILWW